MALDVALWLEQLGLGQYTRAFRDNDIDGDVLAELTAEDIGALGITSIGHRRRLLAAIAALRKGPAAGPPDAAEGGGAERRLLSILFCDLVGSTELATRLDPEDFREIIAAYHRCVGGVLTRFGGFIAKFMGDGILAYFGYPQAREEDAEQAVRAGLAIVAAVGRLALRERLQVRLGVATGEVIVGDLIGAGAAQEQSVVGETPNLAARLQAIAGADALVIADATRRQVGSLFELRDLGPQSLKGFAGTPRAWQVLRESSVASRFEALRSRTNALVGRDEEIALLHRRWERAKSGAGQAVLLSAEPGIGKSRLIETLQERIGNEPHQRLQYFCSPHHTDSALHPIIGHLERAAGFSRDDDAATRRNKLAAMANASGVAAGDLPLLADLLSLPMPAADAGDDLSPLDRKERTFALLLDSLGALARGAPVLMLFEDLHWMDATSRELLERTVARIEQWPVLLIATTRPEYQPPWLGQAHTTLLALTRLSRQAGAALVRELTASAGTLPADVIEEIIERTDGVPLFLEEVTKVVLEAADGRSVVAAVPGARAQVPATLQASLLARLDRLGPTVREVAQAGAAIGRDFAYDVLVAAASRPEAEVSDALDRLAGAGLVFQRGVPPSATYQFKHALVQDTAYGTLLRGPRQALHGRIAAALEAHAADRLEREPEILAYHLTEAGSHERAAAYWLEAGRRAAARSANVEAHAHLRRGIDSLATVADSEPRLRLELALQLALGPIVQSSLGFTSPEAYQAYRRARDLTRRIRDERAGFAATWGLWLSTAGQNTMARQELVDELFPVAGALRDDGLLLQAHHAAWTTKMFHGELVEAKQHVETALTLYDRKAHGWHALSYGGHDPGVCAFGQGGMMLWMLGYPDRAAQQVAQGTALAEDLAHMPSIGHALWFACIVHLLRRDVARALSTGERLFALGRDHKLTQYRVIGAIMRGWGWAHSGRLEAGLHEIREAIEIYRTNTSVMPGLVIVTLAEIEMLAGHAERAHAALDAAEAAIERTYEYTWSTNLHRVRGDLAVGADPAAAETEYRRALVLAQQNAAKSFELRAALGLARLRQGQGQRAAARELLAPLYAGFGEGLDTGDLREAKLLLDALA